SSKKSTPKNQPVNPMIQTDARSAPPIYKQYDKAIQYPTNSSGNKPTNNNPTSATRPFNNTSSPSQAGNSFTSQNIMQLTKEKNLAIISSLKDSTAALTKKQEEKRKVDAIMASIQGPQFNVDFFNKIGSLYNRVSGWCNERGKEIKEVGDNFKKGGKELGDQLNEALLGGLQSVSDSVVAVSEAISNMTWKDWKKAAISFTAGTATFAVLFVPGGGVVGAVVNGFVAGGMAGAAGSIAGDSYEVVDAIASKNQDELFEKYGVKDWAELGNRVLDQAGTSMVKGAIFGSLAAGTQEIIKGNLSSDDGNTSKNIVINDHQYLEQLDNFSENKINHIINGSSGSDHSWNLLVPDKNWQEIKKIISQVMNTGVEGPYKTVYSKKAIINGLEVEITYTKLNDGIIKISDAWIIQKNK
uniref:polymorphic toxin type 35 domain-containing protein n=1 Tax=Holdemania filiformis TaxID=61171 RepID=UPI0022E8E6BB